MRALLAPVDHGFDFVGSVLGEPFLEVRVGEAVGDQLVDEAGPLSRGGLEVFKAVCKVVDAFVDATDPTWKDLLLFYEHYHGDTGRGLGASHQTGWSGLVALLLSYPKN